MNRLIYLDNSATTKPSAEAVDLANKTMTENFGNPSSLYLKGMEAENILTKTREQLSTLLECREDEIFFNSCGSEGNNTAIFGSVELKKRYGKHIVTTSVEHPSVLEPIKYLENNGYSVTYIKPEKDGNILPEKIKDAIRQDTVFVSVMYVNNETGAIFPVELIRGILKEKGSNALFHTDCVQALGKLKINLKKIDADIATFSAHKIHGLKGTGAIYVKKGTRLPPLILGGGQEKGFRSGTEGVPGIAAFSGALGSLPDVKNKYADILELKNYAIEKLLKFSNVIINSPENSLPYILNFSFTGYRSETLLHFLEGYNICVSSGSACSKGKGSYVLREMGLEQKKVDSALRISFSRENNKEDIDALCSALENTKFLKKSGR